MPVVDDRRLRAQEQKAAVIRSPVAHMRRAVRVLHRAVRAKILRVPAAAGETPGAGQPVAALDPDAHAVIVPRAPGEPRPRSIEHRGRRLMRHRGGRGRRRDVRLIDEPAHAGVAEPDGLAGPAIIPANAVPARQGCEATTGAACPARPERPPPPASLPAAGRSPARACPAAAAKRGLDPARGGGRWLDGRMHQVFLNIPVDRPITAGLETRQSDRWPAPHRHARSTGRRSAGRTDRPATLANPGQRLVYGAATARGSWDTRMISSMRRYMETW